MGAAYERLSLDEQNEKAETVALSLPVAPRRTNRPLVLGLSCAAAGLAVGYLAGQTPLITASTLAPTLQPWQLQCSPYSFDQGQWVQSGRPTLETFQDVLQASNYSVCKAEYQQSWNFGVSAAAGGPYHDAEAKRSYIWQPHPSCTIAEASMVDKLQALVDSPVFFAGDSRSRQHFAQMSCELGEHVTWIGARSPSDDNKAPHEWRFEPQNLYLDPQSPLFSQLRLPRGFDISLPILSLLLAYTPQSREEMRQLQGPGVEHALQFLPVTPPGSMVNEFDSNRTISPFTAPESHYKVMLLTTGAHFGPGTLFGNYRVQDVLSIMRASLKAYHGELLRRLKPGQQVYVRAALQAHGNCATSTEPLHEIEDEAGMWNFGYMDELNRVLESETLLNADPRLKWIGLNRIARLRPDAHLPGDCQHFSVGSGVFENVSKYLWHVLLNQ